MSRKIYAATLCSGCCRRFTTATHPDRAPYTVIATKLAYCKPRCEELHAERERDKERWRQEEQERLEKREADLRRREEALRRRPEDGPPAVQLPPGMEVVQLRVIERGLMDVPVFGNSIENRNWAASITLDPDVPGGINRTWWRRGRGDFYYIVPPDLERRVPLAVEFAADKISQRGGKVPRRWYGVIVDVTARCLTACPCPSPRDAADLVERLRTERDAAPPEERLPSPPTWAEVAEALGGLGGINIIGPRGATYR